MVEHAGLCALRRQHISLAVRRWALDTSLQASRFALIGLAWLTETRVGRDWSARLTDPGIYRNRARPVCPVKPGVVAGFIG
jgi:hypothetical protein